MRGGAGERQLLLACRLVLFVEARGARVEVAHVAAVPVLAAVAAEVAAMAEALLEEEAVLVELGHEEALLDGEGIDQSVGHEGLAVNQEDAREEERSLHGANGGGIRVAVVPMAAKRDDLDAGEDLRERRQHEEHADDHILAHVGVLLTAVRLQVRLFGLRRQLVQRVVSVVDEQRRDRADVLIFFDVVELWGAQIDAKLQQKHEEQEPHCRHEKHVHRVA